MAFVLIALGLTVLFGGRRFRWLFVTAIGFGGGLVFAPRLLAGRGEVAYLIAALAGGFVGAMLALVLQKVAVGMAALGFGSFLALRVSAFLSASPDPRTLQWWILFIVGGAAAAILVFAAFDLGLTFLACLAGATMIVSALGESVRLPPAATALLFAVLLMVGLFAQMFVAYSAERRDRT